MHCRSVFDYPRMISDAGTRLLPSYRYHLSTVYRSTPEAPATGYFDMLESLELDRQLQLGLDALGFSQATEVQEAVIPQALEGADLRVSAETGSGKTLAYLIPLAQTLLATTPSRNAGTLALVLVPTRELARQVLKLSLIHI